MENKGIAIFMQLLKGKVRPELQVLPSSFPRQHSAMDKIMDQNWFFKTFRVPPSSKWRVSVSDPREFLSSILSQAWAHDDYILSAGVRFNNLLLAAQSRLRREEKRGIQSAGREITGENAKTNSQRIVWGWGHVWRDSQLSWDTTEALRLLYRWVEHNRDMQPTLVIGKLWVGGAWRRAGQEPTILPGGQVPGCQMEQVREAQRGWGDQPPADMTIQRDVPALGRDWVLGRITGQTLKKDRSYEVSLLIYYCI